MSGFLCLLFLMHDETQRPKCRHAHQKKSNKKLNLFSRIKLNFLLKYISFLNVFSYQFWYMPWMTELFYTATGMWHVILRCRAQILPEKKKSDINGHHWVNSYLFILLGHIKNLYTNGIENPIARPYLRGWFHDFWRMEQFQQYLKEALASDGTIFWEVHARVICCIFCLFFLIASLYSLAIAVLVVIHSAVQMSNSSCRSEALLTLCL